MTKVKTIYFVRHGQTEWNAIRRMQGQRNSDLSERGKRQAEVTGRLLARFELEAIYASPLDRVRQTVEIIRQFVDLDPTYDARIMEWDCGDWSGHLHDDVRTRWPDEWAALEADRFHYRGPNCENYPDMIARAEPFLRELMAAPARSIAVVSHGMIGRVMVGTLMGYDADEMLRFYQANDVVYRLRCPLDGIGERTIEHFEAGSGPVTGSKRYYQPESA